MSVWFVVFFFKQKTAYEMRISDWSSDVCSSDLSARRVRPGRVVLAFRRAQAECRTALADPDALPQRQSDKAGNRRDQEDRKSVVSGKSVSVRVDLGGRRIIKKKKNIQ